MTTEQQTLKLDQIRIDGGTQPRVSIDEEVVAEYAEKYSSGVDLKPVIVFFDGATYWLADGFHRYWANRKIESDYIFAHVHQGTQRDAILYSVGANTDHGLRRTPADKRKAALTMLEDAEWSTWPHADIAKACGVSREYVCRLASSMSASCDRSQDEVREVSRAGKKYRQNTARIGRTGKRGQSRGAAASEMNPVRQPRPALAQTNLNLPHDPAYGARAIVAAMGEDYAHQLIDSLTSYLRDKKEGDA
jgi:hypothetical protein